MNYRLRYTSVVQEAVRHLPPESKQVISAALDEIGRDPYGGVPLVDELKGLWKYRAKKYRIVYEISSEKREVVLHLIDRRETVYERLREVLGR